MMSDEKNPMVEEVAEEVDAPVETTPVEITTVADGPTDQVVNDAADAVDAMVTAPTDSEADGATEAEAVETPTAEAAVVEETALSADSVPPSTPPASTPHEEVTLGPREYTPAYESGGRSRRTSIDVRLEEVNYKNIPLLSRFLDPRGRILSRRKTRVSAKAQRRVVNSIKLARHLALLPYTAEQSRIVRKRR